MDGRVTIYCTRAPLSTEPASRTVCAGTTKPPEIRRGAARRVAPACPVFRRASLPRLKSAAWAIMRSTCRDPPAGCRAPWTTSFPTLRTSRQGCGGSDASPRTARAGAALVERRVYDRRGSGASPRTARAGPWGPRTAFQAPSPSPRRPAFPSCRACAAVRMPAVHDAGQPGIARCERSGSGPSRGAGADPPCPGDAPIHNP